MRGLLLKDWYQTKKYCRSYLLVALVFIAVSLFVDDSMFFVFYPCMLCGILPVNLIGYDERSRWMLYSAALPYTRTQIVSAKYLIGLLAQAAVLLLTGTAQGIKMVLQGSFRWDAYLPLMLSLLIVAAVTSSICLPFIFKMGVEKGRTAYFVMIGFVCAASILVPRLLRSPIRIRLHPNVLLAIFAAAGLGIYGLSWYLSVRFYKKREL